VLNRGRPIVYNDIGYRIIFELAAASAFEKVEETGEVETAYKASRGIADAQRSKER